LVVRSGISTFPFSTGRAAGGLLTNLGYTTYTSGIFTFLTSLIEELAVVLFSFEEFTTPLLGEMLVSLLIRF